MDAQLKLKTVRENVDIFWAALLPVAPIGYVVIDNFDFSILSILFLLACYSVSLVLWFTYGTKPPVWIKNDVLHIRDGLFTVDKIEKSKVESIHYEVNYHRNSAGNSIGEKPEEHVIVIKLKGFNEWRLVIEDLAEHAEQLRLYHFINDNFINLELRRI